MGWTVALTKPGSEHIAELNLKRQNFETYLPKYLTRVGKEVKVKMLFPRYIFVKIESQWHSVNGTRGITRLIMNESKPAQLSGKVIEDLKSRENADGMIDLPAAPPKFKEGDRVRVVKGPLKNYIAVYKEMRPNDRVRALMEMLGQTVEIEVDEGDLMTVVSKKEDEVEL